MRIPTTYRALTAVAVALSLLLASCGSGDDTPDTAAEADTDTAPVDDPAEEPAETDAPAETDEVDPPADAPTGGAVATITVGDTTYTFDLESGPIASCRIFAGETFFGNGYAADDSDVGFEFPVEGSERAADASAYIEVNDAATGAEWAAGNNDGRTFEPGTSQVDSVTIDGRSASGTATFIDASIDDRVPTSGSFEVTCP